MVFDKVAKTIQGGKIIFTTNGAEITAYANNEIGTLSNTIHKKWIIGCM